MDRPASQVAGEYVIDGSIPHGNVAEAQVSVEDGRAVVRFSADPRGAAYALWFCFRLQRFAGAGNNAAGKLRLVLQHLQTLLGALPRPSLRPVYRLDGGGWQRMDAPQFTEYPDGRMEAWWEIDSPASFVDVATCYPYGRDQVISLARESGLRQDVIGLSRQARPINRLSNSYGAVGSDRPGIYIVARQHAGETPGSWVLDGFLRGIAAVGERGPAVWAVPLANIDGVENGDYGKDGYPFDLNRAWVKPLRREALVIRQDMAQWARRCRPMLCLDFHAPGWAEKELIYTFMPHPTRAPGWEQSSRAWSAAFAKALSPEFAGSNFARLGKENTEAAEALNFSSFCCQKLGVQGLTLECGWAAAGEVILTIERYREMGARLAAATLSPAAGSRELEVRS